MPFRLHHFLPPAFRHNYVHALQTFRISSLPDRLDELLKTFCAEERPHEAFEMLASVDLGAATISRDSIYHLLQHCIARKDIHWTRRIHCLVISNGLEWIPALTDHLVRAFACCDNLPASNQVFFKLSVASAYTWNAIISAHVNLGGSNRALRLYGTMQRANLIRPDKVTFLHVLQACSIVQEADAGNAIHAEIVSVGLDSDVAIASSLVRMYAQCGALQEGRKVFDGIADRDIVMWGALVSGYARHGYDTLVLELFEKLQKEGIQPDRGMYMALIKSCGKAGNIEWGHRIHRQLRERTLHSDADLGSALIGMYSALGSLKDAYDTFEQMANRDVVTWSSMMSAYVQHGVFFAVLRLYEDMEHHCIEPDHIIFLFLIKACIGGNSLPLGRLIHACVIIKSFDADVLVNNSIIDLYMKFGSLDEANTVFQNSAKCDVATFDVLIAGYVENGRADIALAKFCEMKAKGLNPNEVTFICAMKACSKCLLLREGRLIHDEIIRSNIQSNARIQNSMVNMYSKCESFEDAEKVFSSLRNKDVATWDALILGAVQIGDAVKSLDLFQKMKQEGIVADAITYLSVTKAVGYIQALKEAHLLHDEIIRSGFEGHSSVVNSLVDMYAKCGSLGEARREFNMQICTDVITWGALIGGYVHNGDGHKAILLFEEMQQIGACPDQATYVSILRACGHSRAVEVGRYVHGLIVESMYASDKIIGNALIDMYIKCGELSRAHQIFDSLTARDIVSWGSMIGGFAKHGLGYAALDLYEQMQQEGLQPTRVHYVSALQACACVGAVEYGRSVYDQIKRSGLELDLTMGNVLMDFHVQYGQLEQAVQIFEELPLRSLPSWNAIMYGYAASGDYKHVIECLHVMLQEGLKPDNVVFTTVLEACNNASLLDEAFQCIKSMIEDFYSAPDIEHYNYLIDILIHAGMPKEASELTHTMPCTPDYIVWMTLLKNCRIYGSEELGCMYLGAAPACISEVSSRDSLLVGNGNYKELSAPSKSIVQDLHVKKNTVFLSHM